MLIVSKKYWIQFIRLFKNLEELVTSEILRCFLVLITDFSTLLRLFCCLKSSTDDIYLLKITNSHSPFSLEGFDSSYSVDVEINLVLSSLDLISRSSRILIRHIE